MLQQAAPVKRVKRKKFWYPKKLLAETKIHGGKSYLCRPIFELAPHSYDTFADIYGGAGSMTYNAPDWVTRKCFNDINWFRYASKIVIRDDVHKLAAVLSKLSYTEETWEHYCNLYAQYKAAVQMGGGLPDKLEATVAWIVRGRMSRGGLGDSFGWSERKRGGQPGDLNAWMNMIPRLPSLSDRLRNTEIWQIPALSAIARVVEMNVHPFIYLDPPYLPQTREATEAYEEDEMDYFAHVDLLNVITTMNTVPIAISGYRNDLYDSRLANWRCVEFDMPNHSGQRKTKQRRIEALWMNYAE
jgi:site-specific DNA-adenine methylase